MKTNICIIIGMCFFLIGGSAVQAQVTKEKNTTTKTKPADVSSTTKAKVASPAATAVSGKANNATMVAQPAKEKTNAKALAPQPTQKVQSATKELPNNRSTSTSVNEKGNTNAQKTKKDPGSHTQSYKPSSENKMNDHKGHNHAKQSHQSHSSSAPNKTKEKTNNGNAHGKNKGGLKGKDFGQDRANQAKSKQNKKKEN